MKKAKEKAKTTPTEKAVKKEVEKAAEETLKRQHAAPEHLPIDLAAAARKVFDNFYKPEELFAVGQAIELFKTTDMMCILVAAVDYVVNNELDNEKKAGMSSDESLGIQKGARRVLTSIDVILRKSMIQAVEMSKKNKQQEEGDVIDAEDQNPQRHPVKGEVGI